MDTFLRAIVKAEFDPDFGDIRRSQTSKPVPPSYPNRRPINTSEHSHQETSPKQTVKACSLCQENHRLSECNKFRCLDIRQKFEHVTSQHLCFSCLLGGHNIFRCRRKNPCGINNCRRYHHRLLHSDPLVTSTILDHNAMLPVVRVTFKAPNGRTLRGNVLTDGGSGTTAIRTGFSTALGLQGRQERLDISGVGGVQFTQRFSRRVNFKISALDGVEEFNMEAYELDKTVMNVPDLDREWLQSFNHLHGISFSQTSGPVELILGVQYSHLHADIDVRQGLPYEPLAKRSLLGWYVIGPAKSMLRQLSSVSICCVNAVNLAKFYEFESLGVKAVNCQCPKVQMSRQDKQAMDSFESTCLKNGERYEIGLPWKRDPSQLPDKYQLAKKRLISLEYSLRKNPVKGQLYNTVMKEYLDNQWSCKLSQDEIDQPVKPVYYLPHHGVYRPEKVSTPLRIVFDPAHLSEGVSLNSFLLKGPCLIGNLFAVLLRFREELYGIVGDLSKMFLQILLSERDSQVHRFLWRNMEVHREPDIYRLLRVTFGDRSSPDMASFVMRRIASENKDTYLESSAILEDDRYKDDLIHSCSSKSEANRRMVELDKMLESGSFYVKEWYCTSKSTSSENEVNLDGDGWRG